MTSNKNEYSVVVRKDAYGDGRHLILRESTQPTGLIKVEELGHLDYGDDQEMGFPDGLIEPTPEEVIRFAGHANLDELASREHSEYGQSATIHEIKQKITSFVIEGIMSGRQPVIAWNDLASQDEIEAFHEAVVNANNVLNPPGPDDKPIGLYL